jgi:hypothetical protein
LAEKPTFGRHEGEWRGSEFDLHEGPDRFRPWQLMKSAYLFTCPKLVNKGK